MPKGKPKKPRHIDGVEHWQCSRCGDWLPRERFSKNKARSNGISQYCKKCRRKQDMARYWADPELSRAKERARIGARTAKITARASLVAAVKRGELERPETCSKCGEPGRIEGHHDRYDKPLDVIWLCSRCHGQRHREINAARR